MWIRRAEATDVPALRHLAHRWVAAREALTSARMPDAADRPECDWRIEVDATLLEASCLVLLRGRRAAATLAYHMSSDGRAARIALLALEETRTVVEDATFLLRHLISQLRRDGAMLVTASVCDHLEDLVTAYELSGFDKAGGRLFEIRGAALAGEDEFDYPIRRATARDLQKIVRQGGARGEGEQYWIGDQADAGLGCALRLEPAQRRGRIRSVMCSPETSADMLVKFLRAMCRHAERQGAELLIAECLDAEHAVRTALQSVGFRRLCREQIMEWTP